MRELYVQELDSAEFREWAINGWLHPKRDFIVAQYLKRHRPLVTSAESRLVAGEAGSEEPKADDASSAPLHTQIGGRGNCCKS